MVLGHSVSLSIPTQYVVRNVGIDRISNIAWFFFDGIHMNRLSNKVAVVIGGNSGIGQAIARRFAAEGAEVFATGRKALDAAALTERSGGAVHPIRADAGSPEDLERVFATVSSQRGRVDVLVVNAGISEFSTLGTIYTGSLRPNVWT